MRKFKIYNPGKSMIPVSINSESGLSQINLLPGQAVEIDETQINDTVRELATPTKGIIRLTEIHEKRQGNKNYVRKNKPNPNKKKFKDNNNKDNKAPNDPKSDQHTDSVNGGAN